MTLLAVMAALLAAWDIVIGYTGRANLHLELKRRFIKLEMAILSGGDDAETWNKHRIDRLRIEQDEPPIFRALDSLCYNEVAKAEGSTHFVPVTRAQRFTRHFWPWGDLKQDPQEATQSEKPA